MKPELHYSTRELHVDLLFLEEFYSSENFRNWFLKNTYLNPALIKHLLRIEHSVIELERESDIIVTFHGDHGEVRFLIENKINAQFQQNQASDYKKRAIGYIQRNECAECITILFAPEAYINKAKHSHHFDNYISYENIIEFFLSEKQMGERAHYKIEVLLRATTKALIATGDPIISKFWEEFWKDISLNVKDLIMDHPGPKPSASTFIFFKNKLPKRVQLVYKFVHGMVDIQMEGIGDFSQEVSNFYSNYLLPKMRIERKGKSTVIRILVPKVDPYLDYETNRIAVQEAQETAVFLYNWFNEHISVWNNLNKLIQIN
ncbi:hypothetical protein [Paenibacillus sp. WC2504]|uniref:hypothetical protein n=1 Tax=Paenibacillus sp. WC2504 TaxID=3461403 RepID=UPI00404654D2